MELLRRQLHELVEKFPGQSKMYLRYLLFGVDSLNSRSVSKKQAIKLRFRTRLTCSNITQQFLIQLIPLMDVPFCYE